MKFNPLLAVIACVLGLIGSFVPLSSSVIDSDFVINTLITFLSCVLGLAGIFLFDKDYMIAMVQYVICGVGALFGMGTYALPSFVLFVIASIITFFEKEKSENFTEKRFLMLTSLEMKVKLGKDTTISLKTVQTVPCTGLYL